MEIDDLDYEKRPIGTNKFYQVHSLSGNGFSQYINHDSYTHKYLNQKPPKPIMNRHQSNDKLFNSTSKPNFFSSKKSLNENEKNNLSDNKNNENSLENQFSKENKLEDFVNFDNELNSNIDNKNQTNEDEYMKETNQPPAETLTNFFSNHVKENNFNLFNRNCSENNKQDNINDSIKILKPKNTFNNNNLTYNKKSYNKLTANLMGSDNANNYLLSKTTKSFQKTTSEKDLSISTQKSFSFQKSNLDPLSRRLNITTSNFRKTFNTDLDNTSNSRFDQNYLKNLNLFINSKSYFNMDKIIENDSLHRKRHDGFHSYNIPHLEKPAKHYNDNNFKIKKPISLLTEKIAKSCIGNKRISYDLSQSPEKKKEVQEENEKLKKIIMIQTSSDFLKKNKLPRIQICVSQPKLKIKKNDLIGGKIKHMGSKYNPYNFLAGRDCETNRRNLVGALFQH